MNDTAWQPPEHNKERPPASRGVVVLIVLVLILILLVVFSGILGRRQIFTQLKSATQEAAIQQVSLISPEDGPKTRVLMLPGNVAAWYEAPIYAQVAGYIAKWNTDYGAPVKLGQVLATIDTPDLDEQLDQAQADLAVAQAHYKLAVLTAKRWQGLAGTQAVSQQQVDVYQADAEAAQSSVMAQQHNVKRFQAQENFKALRAPFDGIVTARRTDIGDFVNASGGTARAAGAQQGQSALFQVADMHEMRVFVDVPQDYAGFMKQGITATFTVQQHPDRIYKADFLTTAKAVTPESRTVVTELTAENADHSLWPGSYATVRFGIPTDPKIQIVPSSAILFHADGLLAFAVDQNNKVHVRKVTAGLDMESTMQIIAGLQKGDRLIASPSESLYEGETVQVVQKKDDNKDGQGKNKSDQSDAGKSDKSDKPDSDKPDSDKSDSGKDGSKPAQAD